MIGDRSVRRFPRRDLISRRWARSVFNSISLRPACRNRRSFKTNLGIVLLPDFCLDPDDCGWSVKRGPNIPPRFFLFSTDSPEQYLSWIAVEKSIPIWPGFFVHRSRKILEEERRKNASLSLEPFFNYRKPNNSARVKFVDRRLRWIEACRGGGGS